MWRVMFIVGCVVGIWPIAGYAGSYVPISVSLGATLDGNPVPRPGALSGPDEVTTSQTYPPGYWGVPFSLQATSQTNLGEDRITLELRTSGTGQWPDAGGANAQATVVFRLTQPMQLYAIEEEDDTALGFFPGAAGVGLTGPNGRVVFYLGMPVTVPAGDYTFSGGAWVGVDHSRVDYGYVRITLQIVPEPTSIAAMLAGVIPMLLRRAHRGNRGRFGRGEIIKGKENVSSGGRMEVNMLSKRAMLMTVVGVLAFAGSAWAIPVYTATKLPGSEVDINNKGQVAGDGGGPGSWLYDGGTIRQLVGGSAHAMNNRGDVVGSANGWVDYSLLWPYGSTTALQIPGIKYPQGINDSGQIVGMSITNHPVLYSDGKVTELDSSDGNAYSINSSGHVVGGGDGGSFLYKDGMLTRLEPIVESFGWHDFWPVMINDEDQIVGSVSSPMGQSIRRACVLGPEGLTVFDGDLLIGGPNDMNNFGEVVGTAAFVNGIDAESFACRDGTMTRIGPLGGVDPLWNLSGINDSGQMIGDGPGGNYLFTPVPEPAAALFAPVALLVLRRPRRK